MSWERQPQTSADVHRRQLSLLAGWVAFDLNAILIEAAQLSSGMTLVAAAETGLRIVRSDGMLLDGNDKELGNLGGVLPSRTALEGMVCPRAASAWSTAIASPAPAPCSALPTRWCG